MIDQPERTLAASLARLRALVAPPHVEADPPSWTQHVGDALRVLLTLPERSVRCIVTSPPYYAQRAYDVERVIWHRYSPGTISKCAGSDVFADHQWVVKPSPVIGKGPWAAYEACWKCLAWRGQLGLEPTPDLYVEHLIQAFGACKRALTDDGTLWVVVGDSWAGSGRGPSGHGSVVGNQAQRQGFVANKPFVPPGMKAKDLMDIPHLLGAYLRAAGWYWRADIIWLKENGIGSNAKDRPSHVYENVLLLSKSKQYHYTDVTEPGVAGPRRLRDVWSIPTSAVRSTHTAAFPQALAERCIRLGSDPGDIVLDPFSGVGTTGKAALHLGRSFVGIELGASYPPQGGPP